MGRYLEGGGHEDEAEIGRGREQVLQDDQQGTTKNIYTLLPEKWLKPGPTPGLDCYLGARIWP